MVILIFLCSGECQQKQEQKEKWIVWSLGEKYIPLGESRSYILFSPAYVPPSYLIKNQWK